MGEEDEIVQGIEFQSAPYRIKIAFNNSVLPEPPERPVSPKSPSRLKPIFRRMSDGGLSSWLYTDALPLSPNRSISADLTSSFKRAASPFPKAKKKRPSPITWRPSQDVRKEFLANVEASGLTKGGYLTALTTGTPPPRRSRRPVVNQQELSQLLGQIGKVGSNLNQLAKEAHLGRDVEVRLSVALDDLSEVRTACMKAMGREP